MNFFARSRIYLYISDHAESSDIAKMRGVDLAARTVARYRRRGVEISLQSDRRVGGRVPSAISMTLHPANVQDAHRTPVPDVSVGRIRVEGDGHTYVYASVRLAGPIRSRSTVTSFAVPSPITHSFHVHPRSEARARARARALKSKAFSTSCPPPPPCHLFHARCHLAHGKGADSKGGPFSLHIDGDPAACTLPDAYANGCGHIISTIDAIMTRNRTDASSMSSLFSRIHDPTTSPCHSLLRRDSFYQRNFVFSSSNPAGDAQINRPSNCLCPRGSIILRSPLVRSSSSSTGLVSIPRYLHFYHSLLLPLLIFLANSKIQCS